MNVLLTGSNGFIGSYFKKKYISKYEITSFSFRSDDFSRLDLTGIDIVIHLSALVHQMGGASQKKYKEINVDQTLALAKKSKASNVKHFIFMSTVKVFGEETGNAYNERTPCFPEDDYGRSKLKAEKEIMKLADANFTVSIIRTPIVYGYGVKANIKSLIDLIKKVPVLPLANIKNSRSMVYIGNLAHLIDVVIDRGQTEIYLAADDEALSTSKFVRLISNELNTKCYLVKIPLFESLLKKLKPSFYKRLYGSLEVDSSLTHMLLNYKNKYTIIDAIKYMLKGEENSK